MSDPKTVTPYDAQRGKKEQVEEMFDNIAHRYDFLNHLLSLNIDKLWRRRVIKLLKPLNPKVMLDVATGTGDFALEAMRLQPDRIVALDLSEEMLNYGRKKVAAKGLQDTIEMVKGDSENLPFDDNTFDAITVGFGVRNFENLEKGLSEMQRVLKPGGRLAVLEFSKPRVFPVKQIFYIYFHFVLPIIGKFFSNDSRAYTYLPESVQTFPEGKAFTGIMDRLGFKQVRCERLTFGISSIYLGEK